MSDATTIAAALLGSVAGGFGHYLLMRRSARVNRGSMLTALEAEVAVLRDLLRAQFEADAGAVAGKSAPTIFPIAYHGRLAAVYDGLSSQLGDLDQREAEAIVRFHTLYKIVVGTAELRGVAGIDHGLVREILTLGDSIVAGPQTPPRR